MYTTAPLFTIPEAVPEAADEIDAWLGSPADGAVDPALVHKVRPYNVALARFAALEAHPHQFLGEVHVVPDHPFFFDHPLDHVPGLLLVEAARQFGIAVAHSHYGVSKDAVFSLRGLETDFAMYADLDEPTFIVGTVSDQVERKGTLERMTFSGGFVNKGRLVGTMTGAWRMIPRRLWLRLRRSAQA